MAARPYPQIQLLYFFPLLGILVYGILKNQHSPLADFANYYFGGFFQSNSGLKLWLYEPAQFNLEIEKSGFKGVFASYSPNPPSLAFLFQPFTIMEPSLSKLVFNITGSLLFFVCNIRWFRIFKLDFRWALIIPFLFFRPIMANLYQGQVYFFLLICLIEGYIALKNNRLWLFSFLWAIPVFLKIFPIILGLYLLASRQFKALTWFFGMLVFGLAFMVSIQGISIWQFFLVEILPHISQGEVIDNFAISFQSFDILFSLLFTADPLSNPNPLINSEILKSIFSLLVKGSVLGFTAGFIAKNRMTYPSLAMAVLAGILLTPTGSVYSLVLFWVFLPILANLMRSEKQDWRSLTKGITIFTLLFFIGNVPFQNMENLPVFLRFTRLFLMAFLWLIHFSKTDFQWKFPVWFLLLLFPFQYKKLIFPVPNDPSVYVALPQKPTMLTGFNLENGFLKYEFRNERGVQFNKIPFPHKWTENQLVSVQKNKIFWKGTMILDSPDMKKSPVLVDGKWVIYMSDKNRGPGFFSLRMLTIANGKMDQ